MMKKLVILFIVLALSMPTYGYILVYRVSMRGTEATLEGGPDGWVLRKLSRRAYLVLDVDDYDPNVLSGVEFMTYYTEYHNKLYDMWTAADDFEQSVLPGRPPKGKNIVRLRVGLSNWDGTTVGGRALGTVKSTDIGTLDGFGNKEKVDVGTSLKGAYESENLCCSAGGGTLSARLDSTWTKRANNPDVTKGFGGDLESFLNSESGPSEDEPKAPRGLINWLESKGYNPVGG